ncbi:MAG: DUF1566 domain-containing protein [Pseudomonadota bacterium]
MIQLPRICTRLFVSAALLSAVIGVQAAGLPDTGVDTCYNDTVADGVAASNAGSIARDAGTHPRQDCRYGRDPATTAGAAKTGAGTKGLDYTKIAINGTVLAAGVALGSTATDWACTRDNITGLTWEVKTTSGLRSSASTYSWYSASATTNGGNVGLAATGSCSLGTGCDTEKFVTDVNAIALCGYSDWRLPSRRELLTLLLMDGTSPAVDATYFPNSVASDYWSSSTNAALTTGAWAVHFGTGISTAVTKSTSSAVRLVRGTQF